MKIYQYLLMFKECKQQQQQHNEQQQQHITTNLTDLHHTPLQYLSQSRPL